MYRFIFPPPTDPGRKPDPKLRVDPDVDTSRGRANVEVPPVDTTDKLSAKIDALLKINSIKVDASLAE